MFVGGRISDNNTAERLRGFVDAHQAIGLTVPDNHKLVTGYSSARVEGLLKDVFHSSAMPLHGLFGVEF